MLILAHADGLGVDLYQLGQRILQPAGNGHRRAQIHIKLGELLGGQLAGGIHRGSGLRNDHIADMGAGFVYLTDELYSHLLRLPAGCTVADGNIFHAVLSDEPCQNGDGLPFLPLSIGGIYHRSVQHLARPVHHGHLAAHAVARIQAHGDLALDRRLHKQRLQVQCKLPDGPLVCLFSQQAAGFPLQGGEDQPVVGVLGGGLDKFHRRRAGLHHRPAQQGQRPVSIQGDGNLQHALLLAPVDGQNLVSLEPGKSLLKIIIQAIHAVLLRGRTAGKPALPAQQAAQRLADVSIIGDLLGNDVRRALKSIGHGVHTLFRGEKFPGGILRPGAIPLLGKQQGCQGLQPFFPCHGGPGAALLLIGAVEILHLRQGLGAVDGGSQLLRQLALVDDGLFYRRAALLQIAQILQPLLQSAQGGVVHGAVELLAVAGNEGNGVPLIQQLHHIFHIFFIYVQFLRKGINDIHYRFFPLVLQK